MLACLPRCVRARPAPASSIRFAGDAGEEDRRRESDLRKMMCWYATRLGQRKPNHPLLDGATGSVKMNEDNVESEGAAVEGLKMKRSS